MDLGEMGSSGVDWMGLTHCIDNWRDFMNALTNFLLGNFRMATQLLASV
jgi:hypothetical protein